MEYFLLEIWRYKKTHRTFWKKDTFIKHKWIKDITRHILTRSKIVILKAKYNSWCRKEFLLTEYVSCDVLVSNTSMASYVGLLLVLSIRILIISCVLCKKEKKMENCTIKNSFDWSYIFFLRCTSYTGRSEGAGAPHYCDFG